MNYFQHLFIILWQTINHCNQSNHYNYDYHVYAFKAIILKVIKFCLKL